MWSNYCVIFHYPKFYSHLSSPLKQLSFFKRLSEKQQLDHFLQIHYLHTSIKYYTSHPCSLGEDIPLAFVFNLDILNQFLHMVNKQMNPSKLQSVKIYI